MKTAILGLGMPEPIPTTTFALTAPGMSGTVEAITPAEATSRAATRDVIESVATGDDSTGAPVAVIGQIELDLRIDPAAAAPGSRGGATGAPTLHVDMRDESTGYAALYVDEDTGAAKWLLDGRRDDTPTQKRLSFELPQVVQAGAPEPTQARSRGIVTATMRALVKVVAWVTDPLVGKAAFAVAKAWENKRRPYGLQQVTAEGELVAPDWSKFTGEATLLLVHGTFSTPAAGFAGWFGGPNFTAVHKEYGGRCLALAHPTMHASPDENVDWLFGALPPGKSWTFDTVSHSRGGLVVRALAARAAADNSCKISRMVMVAPPNFGTPLADASHWTTFLNAHTNLLITSPDTVSTIVAEGVLCLVKILGTGAADNLPGLAAMNLAGDYLPALARRIIANTDGMFAVAANYTPANRDALKQLMLSAADAAVDSFFTEPNDLVVPTLGCSQGSIVAAGFPIADNRLMKLSGATHHCNVFQNPTVQQQVSAWLTTGRGAASGAAAGNAAPPES